MPVAVTRLTGRDVVIHRHRHHHRRHPVQILVTSAVAKRPHTRPKECCKERDSGIVAALQIESQGSRQVSVSRSNIKHPGESVKNAKQVGSSQVESGRISRMYQTRHCQSGIRSPVLVRRLGRRAKELQIQRLSCSIQLLHSTASTKAPLSHVSSVPSQKLP